MSTPDDNHIALFYPGPQPETPDKAQEIRGIATKLHQVAADCEQQADRYSQAAENVEQNWRGLRANMWMMQARQTESRLRRYAEAIEDCANELQNYARLLDQETPQPRFQAYAESGSSDWITRPESPLDIETVRIAERISQLAFDFFIPEPIPMPRPPIFMPMDAVSTDGTTEQAPAEDMSTRTRAAHRIVGSAPSSPAA